MVKSNKRSSAACHQALLRQPWKRPFPWLQPQNHMRAAADLKVLSSVSALLARSHLPSESIDCPQPQSSSHTQQSSTLTAQSLIPNHLRGVFLTDSHPATILPFSPPLLIPRIPHFPSPTHKCTFTLSQSQKDLLQNANFCSSCPLSLISTSPITLIFSGLGELGPSEVSRYLQTSLIPALISGMFM